MSRVTMKDIYWELSSDQMFRDFMWDSCKDIEVVPRKMVEMIIERLKEHKANTIEDSYTNWVLGDTLDYAESLLKQFEEDN